MFIFKPFVYIWKFACWFVEDSDSPSSIVQESGAEEFCVVSKPELEGDVISESQLAELAIQIWRLERRITTMDPNHVFGEPQDSDPFAIQRAAMLREKKKLADSTRRLRKFLEGFEVEYEDPTGGRYDPGLTAIEVLSWEESDGPAPAFDVIKDTVRPLVRKKSKIIKIAQVVCVEGVNQ